jgi:hypothetical protein
LDDIKRGLGQTKDLSHSAQAKLTEILDLRKQGLSLSAVGRRLGLTHQSVKRAVKRAGKTAD